MQLPGSAYIKRLLTRKGAATKPKPTGATDFRPDADVFALRGDNMWGHSITWSSAPGEDGHDANHGRIVGWLSRRPKAGDVLAVQMVSGKWGKWLIESVDYCRDPNDMFFAQVSGALDYLDDDDVPSTASRTAGMFLR